MFKQNMLQSIKTGQVEGRHVKMAHTKTNALNITNNGKQKGKTNIKN